jgi:hypothetical protein
MIPRQLPVVAAFLAAASPAWAGASAQDQAAAEVLFQDAKKLVAARNYAEACPKFLESQRLDPGAGTLLNIADCYEHLGKYASSWGAFKEVELVAKSSGDSARQTEAARRAALLEPRLSRLSIVVPPAVRAIPGFEVKKDGSTIGEGQSGSAIPIDPGEHVLEASAPGRRTWTTRIAVTGPGVQTVEVPGLEEQPGLRWNAQRSAGVALGAAGLAGLGVAAGFTAKMLSKNSASLQYCAPADATKCMAPGIDLRNQAFDAAHVATGAVIAGGVALGAGIAVFFTAPSGEPREGGPSTTRAFIQPIVGPGLAGASLQGAW